MFRLGLESSKCPLSFFSTEGCPRFRSISKISHKPDRNRSGSALFSIFHQNEVLESSRKF